MKQKLCFIVFAMLCCLGFAQAQTIVNMPLSGEGETQTSMTGTLYDSGGTGEYTNNVDSWIVIDPPGNCSVTLTFSELEVETCCDWVRVYDGVGVDAPQIGQYNTLPLEPIISTNGSLTVHFHTDGSVLASGFVATWVGASGSTDATFLISDSNPPANAPIAFLPATDAAQYAWDFGDGTTSSEAMPEHSYTAPGTYNVSLTITNCDGDSGSFSSSLVVQDFSDITYDPESFFVSLDQAPDSVILPLTINNNGGGDLIFSIEGASLQTDKGMKVLSINNFVTSPEHGNTITAINTFFSDYSLVEASPTSAAALSDLLATGVDVVLITEMEACSSGLFASFAPVLQEFCNNGGTVIFNGSADGTCIFSTGLFSGTHGESDFSNGPMDITTATDPLLDGVVAPYSALVVTYLYDFTNPDIVHVIEKDGKDVVAYRPIGDGRAIFIGHDYKFSNNNMKHVIANAVKSTGNLGGSQWLYVSDNLDTLSSGQSVTIDVEFNAANICGGTYTTDLILNTNDPDQPQIVIPCTVVVSGTASYGPSQNNFNFGEIQQFDTESRTLIIYNNGSSQLLVNSITSSDPAFQVNPSSFVVEGCGTEFNVELVFAPTDIATHTTTFTITTNIGTFTVTGTGVSVGAPVTTISPNPFTITVNAGETAQSSLTLNNSGLGPLTYSIDTSNFDSQVSILLYTKGIGDFNQTEVVISDIIDNYIADYAITALNPTSASQLAEQINNYDLLIIPRLTDLTGVTFLAQTAVQAVLQEYMDNGGTIIFTGSSIWDGVSQYQNPAFTSGLFSGNNRFNSGSPVEILNPNHPLTEGINEVYASSGGVQPLDITNEDAVFLANQLEDAFNGGGDVLAYREISNGKAIYIGVNYDFFSGNVDEERLLANAVQWVITTELADWLTLPLNSGTVGFPEEQGLTLMFDATNLLGGTYTTEMVIETNDPVQPTIILPIIMTVVGVPQIVPEAFSLDFGSVVIGNSETINFNIANPGTDTLFITNLQTASSDFTVSPTSLVIPPLSDANIQVTFTPTSIQNYTDALIIENNVSPMGVTLTAVGQGAPSASTAPTALDVTLLSGSQTSQTLTISNTLGQGALDWEMPGSGTINALLLSHGANLTSYANLQSALSTYAPTVNITQSDAENADDLANALAGINILIVPTQDQFSVSIGTLSSMGTAMQDFVNDGGAIIFMGSSCNMCLPATNLWEGNYSYGMFGFDVLANIDADNPITENIPTSYTPSSATYIWNFSNSDITILAEGPFGGQAIAYREVGLGKVIYFGHNFETIDPQMSEALANAVDYGALNLPEWLSVSINSGNVPIGQNNTIDVTFNADGLLAGVYTFDILVFTNDPQNPVITVPVTMNVEAFPQAAFAANNTLSCDGIVAFTDLSVNNPTAWSWDFGDGNTSTAQNPVHTYDENGTYDVSLTVTNSLGADTYTLQDYITVNFALSYCDTIIMGTSGSSTATSCQGVLIDNGGISGNYTNGINTTLTLAPPGAQAIILDISEIALETCCDYFRVFDGPDINAPSLGVFQTGNPEPIQSTGPTMTIQFTTDGSVVQSGFLATWQCIIIDEVPNVDYVATVITECEGLVEFTDASSDFPSSWTWDFGDGSNVSNEENPEHSFPESGTYNVSLTACNIVGCTTEVIPFTINNVLNLEAYVTSNGIQQPLDNNVPDTVKLNTPVLFQDQTGEATDWTWQFGNGNGANGVQSPITFYSQLGTYTLTLTVGSATGCERILTSTIIVTQNGPTVGDVSINSPIVDKNLTVQPNPSDGLFVLDYGFEGQQDIAITVSDLAGRQILTQQNTAANQYHTTLDLSNQPAGMYFVKITTPDGMATRKLIVR